MKTAKDYKEQIYIDETFEYAQVVRWKSNDTVPPKDILADLCVAGYITSECLYDSIATKNQEDAAFLEEYVARRQKYGYSDEEKFEMRAAFGDEEVVDIFTGEVVQYA
jgi:hypothetical protein